MPLYKSILLFCLVSFLISCASGRVEGYIYDTEDISNPTEVKLPRDVIEAFSGRFQNEPPFMVVIKKGAYSSRYKTADGIYYIGSPRCIEVDYKKGIKGSFLNDAKYYYRGGFFAPYNTTKPVRWWILAESGERINRYGNEERPHYFSPQNGGSNGFTSAILGGTWPGVVLRRPLQASTSGIFLEIMRLKNSRSNSGQTTIK